MKKSHGRYGEFNGENKDFNERAIHFSCTMNRANDRIRYECALISTKESPPGLDIDIKTLVLLQMTWLFNRPLDVYIEL